MGRAAERGRGRTIVDHRNVLFFRWTFERISLEDLETLAAVEGEEVGCLSSAAVIICWMHGLSNYSPEDDEAAGTGSFKAKSS